MKALQPLRSEGDREQAWSNITDSFQQQAELPVCSLGLIIPDMLY